VIRDIFFYIYSTVEKFMLNFLSEIKFVSYIVHSQKFVLI